MEAQAPGSDAHSNARPQIAERSKASHQTGPLGTPIGLAAKNPRPGLLNNGTAYCSASPRISCPCFGLRRNRFIGMMIFGWRQQPISIIDGLQLSISEVRSGLIASATSGQSTAGHTFHRPGEQPCSVNSLHR
uniref:Uncharacterized protein n=1 Tax=Pseudomonas fluorescens (strain SBW25) TaxID=216595 RepID=A4V7N0_PSEFS|nr:hypothetical protein pQBR0121 [Pseudomonas fluorescens SBW25]